MFIKVDIREQELLKHIKQLVLFIPIFKQIRITTENLPLGDIIISNETTEELVIERKSISDLLSSIKDGRYEEQSYRLNGLNHHNHNIIYMVEGDVNKNNNRFKDNNLEKLTAYSAMFSLNYFKGFSVFRSFSIDETALIICNMAYKLEKDLLAGKKPFYKNNILNQTQPPINNQVIEAPIIYIKTNEDDNNIEKQDNDEKQEGEKEQSDKDYISVIKKVKKENITPDNISEIMLCQIPGISSVTAIAIINKFKTLSNLIKEIEQCEDCLKDITYTNAKGQTRKINKTCLTNIVKFLLKK